MGRRRAWLIGSQLLIVAGLLAIALPQCRLSVAATQFGLYMAVSNPGRTIASALLGPLEHLGGEVAVMLVLAASGVIGAAVLLRAACLDSPDAGAAETAGTPVRS